VVGHDDPIASPALLEGWEGNASAMTVERLPAVGHFIPEEAPEAVVAAVTRILGTDGAQRRHGSRRTQAPNGL